MAEENKITDEALASFVSGSESAVEQLRREEAVLVIKEIIDNAGVTEPSDILKEELVERGVGKDYVNELEENLSIEGVEIIWDEEKNSYSIKVDKDSYENGDSLKEGKEFENVDDDYFIFPKEADIIEHLIKENHNVLLIGPAGAGKTELLERIAQDRLGRTVLPFNMTEETTTDDLVGQISLKDNGEGGVETVFNYGPLSQCMRNGWIFQIDELDVAEQGVLFQLQRVLEGKDLIVSKKCGERITPHEDFAIVATSNTAGRGDQADIYKARQILDEAFLDRWGAVFRINYISENDEIKVLRRKTGIGAEQAKIITKIAKNARNSFGREVLTTFSLRKSIQIANLLSYGYSMTDSFKIAVTNKATDEDAQALAEIFQRISGEKIDLSERFMGESDTDNF
ncbi:MAG: AAA family ATPase [Elusimicrobiota bacterium]